MVSAAATAFLALIGGLITLAVKAASHYIDGAPERKRQADALAQLELKGTMDAMAAVDRQLDGVQPDQRESILLSPDDHL